MRPALVFTLCAALLAVVGLAGYRYRHAIGWGDDAHADIDRPPAYDITFERWPCLGECPDFVLKIDRTGKVELRIPPSDEIPLAIRSTTGITVSGAPLSPARYAALARKFDTGGFRKLKRLYSTDGSDGPTTKITMESSDEMWSSQVYMVPCVNLAGPVNAKTLQQWGVTEFVPNVFCDLARELDQIACDAYLSQKGLNPSDTMNPFRPSHCKRTQ